MGQVTPHVCGGWPWDADVVAEPLLVGFAASDEQAQTVVIDGEVADVEGDQFAAA